MNVLLFFNIILVLSLLITMLEMSVLYKLKREQSHLKKQKEIMQIQILEKMLNRLNAIDK